MLHIILTILKILGFVLLGILGLILALLLIVLLVPFKYDVSGKYYEVPEAKAKVTWLFGALKVWGEFKDKKLRAKVSFLWFKLFDTQKEPEESKEIPSKDLVLEEELVDADDVFVEYEQKTETVTKNLPKPEDETDKPIVSEEKIVSAEPIQKTEKKKQPFGKSRDKKEEKPPKDTPKREKVSIGERVNALIEKISAKIENIEQKLDDLSIKIDKVEKFISAECTQNSIQFVKRVLWSVLMHIRPKKVFGYLHFGLGKPSDTGKVLGYASMFYSLYGDSIRLHPDFEQSIIEGDLCVKGSIQLYIFVYWGLRGLLNKDIRRLIKYIKHLKG